MPRSTAPTPASTWLGPATAATLTAAPAAAAPSPAMMPACGRRAATRRAAGCTPMPAANARTVISPAYPADRVRALVTSSGSTTMASDTEPKTNGAGSATPSQNSLVRSAAGGERRRAERQVREVRHDQGIARPLSEERGDDGTKPESGAQRKRGAARVERVAAGQVLDARGRRADYHAGAQPRQSPPGRDQRQAVRADDEQQRGHRRKRGE